MITAENINSHLETVNHIETIIKTNAQDDPQFVYNYLRSLVVCGLVERKLVRLFYDIAVKDFGLRKVNIDILLSN